MGITRVASCFCRMGPLRLLLCFCLSFSLLSFSLVSANLWADVLERSSKRSSQAASKVFDSGEARVTLLELFSSQGCSSCPPAEQWMSALKDDHRLWQDFVPVVFHVDYWDHLGWSDPYASMKNSQRQRRYRLFGHTQAVYTPGFMLSGTEWSGWFSNPALPELPKVVAGRLKIELDADKLQARFVRSQDNRGLLLNVAILGFDIVTPISAGENQGKQIPQDFVVLKHQSYTSDNGLWNVTLPRFRFEGRTGIAFWVSQGSDPLPLQATGGWL